MGNNSDAIFLAILNQGLLGQIGMSLDLTDNRFNFAEGKQIGNELAIKIANAQISGIALPNTLLHKHPILLKPQMTPSFAIRIQPNKRPMNIVQINIFEFH